MPWKDMLIGLVGGVLASALVWLVTLWVLLR